MEGYLLDGQAKQTQGQRTPEVFWRPTVWVDGLGQQTSARSTILPVPSANLAGFAIRVGASSLAGGDVLESVAA
jgi:hypothetical protein